MQSNIKEKNILIFIENIVFVIIQFSHSYMSSRINKKRVTRFFSNQVTNALYNEIIFYYSF